MLKVDYPEPRRHEPRPRRQARTGNRSPRCSRHYLQLQKGLTQRLEYTGYMNNTETVSANGKLQRDVTWLVVKPAEKTTAMYDKQ